MSTTRILLKWTNKFFDHGLQDSFIGNDKNNLENEQKVQIAIDIRENFISQMNNLNQTRSNLNTTKNNSTEITGDIILLKGQLTFE